MKGKRGARGRWGGVGRGLVEDVCVCGGGGSGVWLGGWVKGKGASRRHGRCMPRGAVREGRSHCEVRAMTSGPPALGLPRLHRSAPLSAFARPRTH